MRAAFLETPRHITLRDLPLPQTGAAGAIGLLLTYLALALGYRTFVTAHNADKVALAAYLGARPCCFCVFRPPAGGKPDYPLGSIKGVTTNEKPYRLAETTD